MNNSLALPQSSDTSVQGTNDDAQVSKLSCVRQGYFKDEYIHHFVRRPSRRSPLINRGYYSRFAALRLLISRFLATKQSNPTLPLQILSLGAGFDTTFFQLRKDGNAPDKYIEVDFPEVTKRKASIIASKSELLACISSQQQDQQAQQQHDETPNHDELPQQQHDPPFKLPPRRTTAAPPPPSPPPPTDVSIDTGAGTVLSPCYSLVAADLRNQAQLEAALQLAGLDVSLPTLVLSECVLVYMEPAASSAVLAGLAGRLQRAVVAVYEQVKPDDAFGRQMVANLASRGCPLKGISATPSLVAHCRRLEACGWRHARAWDMDSVYRRFLDPADKARIEVLELFDEYEEWHMIQEHYSISCATTEQQPGGLMAAVAFEV